MKKANLSYFVYFGIILLLVVVSVSGSFAWYTASVKNNGEVYNTVVTAGSLRMGFENSQYMNVDDMVIISPEEIASLAPKSTFDVKNVGSSDASYELYFNATVSNNLIHEDFKWELLIDGESVKSGNFGTLTKNTNDQTTTAQFKITNTPVTLNVNQVNSCVFRVWLQEANRNQIDLTEGTLSGNVSIIAVTK